MSLSAKTGSSIVAAPESPGRDNCTQQGFQFRFLTSRRVGRGEAARAIHPRLRIVANCHDAATATRSPNRDSACDPRARDSPRAGPPTARGLSFRRPPLLTRRVLDPDGARAAAWAQIDRARVSLVAPSTRSSSASETTPKAVQGTDSPIPPGNPKSDMHAGITPGAASVFQAWARRGRARGSFGGQGAPPTRRSADR
jgi:hypothetical protein